MSELPKVAFLDGVVSRYPRNMVSGFIILVRCNTQCSVGRAESMRRLECRGEGYTRVAQEVPAQIDAVLAPRLDSQTQIADAIPSILNGFMVYLFGMVSQRRGKRSGQGIVVILWFHQAHRHPWDLVSPFLNCWKDDRQALVKDDCGVAAGRSPLVRFGQSVRQGRRRSGRAEDQTRELVTLGLRPHRLASKEGLVAFLQGFAVSGGSKQCGRFGVLLGKPDRKSVV